MQVVFAHDTPDSIIADITQSFGNQPAIPVILRKLAAYPRQKGLALALRELYDEARTSFEEALRLHQQMKDVLGEANCIKSLGEISFRLSLYDDARKRFDEAQPLYQQAEDLLGESNCIKNLGQIALACSDLETARTCFRTALKIYVRISEWYSVGMAHRTLAHLTSDTAKRKSHVIAAIGAWEQISRDDLIALLRSEFPNFES